MLKFFKKIGLNIYRAFLCEKKNGDTEKTFSSKKFYAFVFSGLAIHNHITLSFFAKYHWSVTIIEALKAVEMTDEWVSSIVITLIGAVDVMAFTALGIYGWAKVRKGA